MAERTTSKELTPAGRLAGSGLHDVIGYQIAQASIATLAVYQRAAGAPLELHPVEYTMLVLVKNPGSTAARLARALAVSAPNITMWLEKLQRRGLVRREASETERRASISYVTDKAGSSPRWQYVACRSGAACVCARLRWANPRSWWSCLRKLTLKRSD